MRRMNRNILKTALSMTRYFAFTVAENQSHRLPYEFWRRTGSSHRIWSTAPAPERAALSQPDLLQRSVPEITISNRVRFVGFAGKARKFTAAGYFAPVIHRTEDSHGSRAKRQSSTSRMAHDGDGIQNRQ